MVTFSSGNGDLVSKTMLILGYKIFTASAAIAKGYDLMCNIVRRYLKIANTMHVKDIINTIGADHQTGNIKGIFFGNMKNFH
jgi:hypothetical protein